MGALFLKELIFFVIKVNSYNIKFKTILSNKDYNDNVKVIKKEMIVGSLSNVFLLLASPFLVLEKGITSILNLIFD